MKYLYLALIIVLILIVAYFGYKPITEGFNRDTGQFCSTCTGKTFNQCMNCFNCGFCVDKWGNASCLAGDVRSGPYNKENCALWYTTDDWTTAVQNNENYRLSYGPKQSNRPIGINPC